MTARSPEGRDGGPVYQLMYTKSSFRSPSVIVMKDAGCICWLVKLLPCVNLSNTTGKYYSLQLSGVLEYSLTTQGIRFTSCV